MARPKAPARDWIAEAKLEDQVRALAQRGELRRFAKGVVLIHEGDVGDTLYILLSGKVRVYGSVATTERELTLGSYGPGEYVGEMGFDGGPRAASVVAVEPTVCAMVTRHTLENFLVEYPAFAFELLAKVIRRARAATLSATDIALNDTYGRLKHQLDRLAVAQPDGGRLVAERLTHLELANRVGCSREMVSRLLKELERGGYIQVSRGQFQLLKALPPRF